MEQEHSDTNVTSSPMQEDRLPGWLNLIGQGLEQLQAIGELMSVCSEDGLESETIMRLGHLIRDKAEEIKALWDNEKRFLQ